MNWVVTLAQVSQPMGYALAAAALIYVLLLGLTVVVGALHPASDRRADARAMLQLLLSPIRKQSASQSSGSTERS